MISTYGPRSRFANCGSLVKYNERYGAMEEMETLELELEEPQEFLRDLKEKELVAFEKEIVVFETLERYTADKGERTGPVLRYWDAPHVVTKAEIKHVKGGRDCVDGGKNDV